MKRLLILLFVVVICTIGVTTVTSISIHKRARLNTGSPPKQSSSLDTGNGASHPELVPDRIAYSLLFRLTSKHHTEAEKDRIRGYVRQMGLGRQRCKSCPRPNGVKDADDDRDIDAFMVVAEEFRQRVGVLDQQAKAIKALNRTTPNPDMMAQLTQLQRQKETIVDELIASLSGRLSADGVQKVRQHVNERVKVKVKMGSPKPRAK